MQSTAQFQWSDRMAWLATALAALASAAGLFVGGLYRDNEAMIAQAKGTDLATLFGAVPALAIGLWFARTGSLRGRLVAYGATGYLVYCYAIYSFQVVVSAATPLHIAIVSLATWSLILGGVSLARLDLGSVAQRLPRRASAAFLALIVVMFAALWLGQIAGAIASGALPAAVTDLDLPTSAVYTLDLAFALPLLAVGAALLFRDEVSARALAVAGLVFIVLMALSILGLFAIQASEGIAVDTSMTIGFAAIAAIAAALGAVGLAPTNAAPARERRVAASAR